MANNGHDRTGAIFIQALALLGLIIAIMLPAFSPDVMSVDWRILLILGGIALGSDMPQFITLLRVIFNRNGGDAKK